LSTAERLAELFKALSNPIRLKILALCYTRERTSRELREVLGISKPLLIAHLRKLMELGLIEYRVVFDEERVVAMKVYRTPRNLRLCIDGNLLSKIAKEIEESDRT